MERRKFIIGAGALLSGSAAAVGTGALSEADVERTATGEIVGDKDAYISLRPYGENSEFATMENGQLALDFSDGGDSAPLNTNGKSTGLGLNADSVNYFDGVFRISANDNGGEMDVWLESDTPRLEFYWSSKKTGATTKANAVTLSTGGNTNVDVGVKIDLDDVDRPQTVLYNNDNFTIHADDADGGGGT